MTQKSRFSLSFRRIVSAPRACVASWHACTWRWQATITVEALHDGIDFSLALTRAKFEELNQDLFKKTLDVSVIGVHICMFSCFGSVAVKRWLSYTIALKKLSVRCVICIHI